MELYIPTRLILAENCIAQHMNEFTKFGKKALIVTGKHSAKASGALQDVTAALDAVQIQYIIFDAIENNPGVETCFRGGELAKREQADFVIAIGGGSPMDAAKAIAAYAANDLEPMDLFASDFTHTPLPLICVPLTAGTGSEVTPYSVLTVKEIENKKSFSHTANFSKIAFLDPRYLKSLPRPVLLDTVADALSHAVESMLCRRSTPASEVYAAAALSHIGAALPGILKGEPDYERLFLASSLAGMAISHTGTVVVHSMGYLLTYYKGVPHGRANALLLPGFLQLCAQHVPDRLQPVLAAFGVSTTDMLIDAVKSLTADTVQLSENDAAAYAAKAICAKNVPQVLWPLTESEEYTIYKSLGH